MYLIKDDQSRKGLLVWNTKKLCKSLIVHKFECHFHADCDRTSDWRARK